MTPSSSHSTTLPPPSHLPQSVALLPTNLSHSFFSTPLPHPFIILPFLFLHLLIVPAIILIVLVLIQLYGLYPSYTFSFVSAFASSYFIFSFSNSFSAFALS